MSSTAEPIHDTTAPGDSREEHTRMRALQEPDARESKAFFATEARGRCQASTRSRIARRTGEQPHTPGLQGVGPGRFPLGGDHR